ncbi:MAG: hypothetical protein K1X83_12200 [Oligoflexia bacterium]|nr:hypothetical protein [Oligoflexia bacterium]
MSMSLGFSLSPRLSLGHRLTLPSNNWSLVDAYLGEGDTSAFSKIRMEEWENLPIEERLHRVDQANQVFRFTYVRSDHEAEGRRKYYKVPLLRNGNLDIDEIKIPISKQEYLRCAAILNNAGRLQRIVRAVSYTHVREEILKHLNAANCGIDDSVIVGIDRGGRVPVHIVKAALGASQCHFLKVDQQGAGINPGYLQKLLESGVFRDKYLLFVDSTVDSGRQVRAIADCFKSPEFARLANLRGWVVVGSNENGEQLPHHLNINWGLDPDQSFEDNPLLMGVDYGVERTLTRGVGSRTSSSIRRALNEVPQGVLLDLSTAEQMVGARLGLEFSAVARESATWRKLLARDWHSRTPMEISEMPSPLGLTNKAALALIGTSAHSDLGADELCYLARGLGSDFTLMAGTHHGNPGAVLAAASREFPAAPRVLLQMESESDVLEDPQFATVRCHGRDKQEFREYMILTCRAALVLGGAGGTLSEALCALYAGKPVVAMPQHGPVGAFLASSRKLKGWPNLHLVGSIKEAVDLIRSMDL